MNDANIYACAEVVGLTCTCLLLRSRRSGVGEYDSLLVTFVDVLICCLLHRRDLSSKMSAKRTQVNDYRCTRV